MDDVDRDTRRKNGEHGAGASDDSDGTNPWAAIVGPCYTREAIPRVLNLSSAAVADASTQLRLLALTTDDDVLIYPAFQVRAGRTPAGLAEVLGALRSVVDDSRIWSLGGGQNNCIPGV